MPIKKSYIAENSRTCMKGKTLDDSETLNGTKPNETVRAQFQDIYCEILRMKQQYL